MAGLQGAWGSNFEIEPGFRLIYFKYLSYLLNSCSSLGCSLLLAPFLLSLFYFPFNSSYSFFLMLRLWSFTCPLVQFFPSPHEFRVSSPCCDLSLGFHIVDHGRGLSFPSCAPPSADLWCLDEYYRSYCMSRLLYCLARTLWTARVTLYLGLYVLTEY